MQHPNFLKSRHTETNPPTASPRGNRPFTKRIVHALTACALAALLISVLPISSRWISASEVRLREPLWTTHVDRLASGNINTLFVDKDQVIWVGTNSGIDRFDGRWQSLRANEGLPQGAFRAIAQTTDGTIWVGGDHGLARINGNAPGELQVTRDASLTESIYALLATTDGLLWVGNDSGVAYYDGTSWIDVPLHQSSGVPARVLALSEAGDGGVWAGGDMLHRIDAHSTRVETIDDTRFHSRIQALLVEPARDNWPETLWVGTAGQGLWSYSDHWRHFGMPEPGQSAEGIASNNILALSRDSDGTLWIGTNGNGVSLFNPDGLSILWGGKNWRTLTTRDGLAADAVASIAHDSSGDAWLATIAGISRLDTQSWWTLATPHQPAVEATTTAFVDQKGRIWFGSDKTGIIVVAGNSIHRITAETSGLPENMVRSVLVDRYDHVWVGTARRGIFRARVSDVLSATKSGSPKWEQFDGETLGSNVIRASLVASDGSVWFGTYNGVHRFTASSNDQGGYWTHFTAEDGLADNIISQNAIAEDTDGNIWVGTSTAINRLPRDAGQWTSYQPGAPENVKILSVATSHHPQDKYAVWAGSEVGDVYALDRLTEQWDLIHQTGSPIYALIAPDDGYLWAGTGAGLIKLDVDSMAQRLYTRERGLSDNEVHVLARESSGTVWAGTQTGILRHVPEHISPTVRIISVNGRSPHNGAVQLLSQTPLEIAVEGSDLATPASELDYRLRIAELNAEWLTKSDEHWSLLPPRPGRYTLEVQAVDGSLNTSAVERVIVEVAPSIVLPQLGRVSASLASVMAITTASALTALAGIALLSTRQRKRRHAALRRRFNPYVSGEPVTTPNMFFGRRETLARIVDTLHENSIMIHGERRIGKTSLLLNLVEHLRTAQDSLVVFVPVYVDLEGTSDDELFSVMMEDLIGSLPSYLPVMPPLRYDQIGWSAYDHREFARDLDTILESLTQTTEKTLRVVLILDEADVMNTYLPVTQQQLRRIFMRTYAHSLGAVVAGVNISKNWDRVESPWYNLFNEVELGPISDTAARELILEPIRGIYQAAPEAVAYIALHSRGKPFLLQQHCMESVNQMLAAGRNKITLDDARRALAELQRHRPIKTRQPARRSLKMQDNPS